jgi:hypothetical protein
MNEDHREERACRSEWNVFQSGHGGAGAAREGRSRGGSRDGSQARSEGGSFSLRDLFALHRARILPLVAAAALAPAAPATSSSSLPQPGSAGVPAGGGFAAEADCTSCHEGFPLNSDGRGFLELRGVPKRYVPGARYTLEVSMRHADDERRRWGFQLTAISASSRRGAGEFVITDVPETQLIHGTVADRQYVSHSYFGTAVGDLGGHDWTFDWIAPDASAGRVVFHGAGSAADLDGSQRGDRIYAPPASKPLAESAPARSSAKGK